MKLTALSEKAIMRFSEVTPAKCQVPVVGTYRFSITVSHHLHCCLHYSYYVRAPMEGVELTGSSCRLAMDQKEEGKDDQCFMPGLCGSMVSPSDRQEQRRKC